MNRLLGKAKNHDRGYILAYFIKNKLFRLYLPLTSLMPYIDALVNRLFPKGDRTFIGPLSNEAPPLESWFWQEGRINNIEKRI